MQLYALLLSTAATAAAADASKAKIATEIVTNPAGAATAPTAADPKNLKAGQFLLQRPGPGCDNCGTTGYQGRMGIYEVLEVNTEISKMIVNHATSEDLQVAAIRDGMLTMQQDGFVKALMGLTTIEEIMRVTRE